ncbi:hypothetical protein [Kribbella jiaozuonensis]|nr:hypothetical protein [Kribbella jiaozuonensis]
MAITKDQRQSTVSRDALAGLLVKAFENASAQGFGQPEPIVEQRISKLL